MLSLPPKRADFQCSRGKASAARVGEQILVETLRSTRTIKASVVRPAMWKFR